MHRLVVLLAAAALSLPACIAGPAPYEVAVYWTTVNPSADPVIAHITYDGETIETHGSLDSHGYAGTALVSGETDQPTIEICVELGDYALVDHQTGYGCESGDYECDPPVREFVALRRRCTIIAPDKTQVELTF